MSKNKRKSKSSIKRSRKKGAKEASIASPNIGITLIRIESGSVIGDADRFQVECDGLAIFIVENHDSRTHKVSIDPKKIKIKGTTKLEDPFENGATLNTKVAPGLTGIMAAFIRSGTSSGKTTTFKYTIESDRADPKDPDLDVIDPKIY